VIEGSPFVCHQGEIRLVPRGRDTEITWTIRFRPRIPGTGALFQSLLGRLLGDVLQKGLRRTVERG
jgi:hypothetical protein